MRVHRRVAFKRMQDAGIASVRVDEYGIIEERAEQNTGHELEVQNEDL